jgi:hypothetical protein
LEKHFVLRAVVRGRDNREMLVPKLCSSDSAKALLATEEARKLLPPIQSVVNAPVFAEDENGTLVVLNQGYHKVNGGTYVLSDRYVAQTASLENAVSGIVELISDFDFATKSDKSRCLAGIISPALKFGRLLEADFPLDLCKADQSQAGKGFRATLITTIYDEILSMSTVIDGDAFGKIEGN